MGMLVTCRTETVIKIVNRKPYKILPKCRENVDNLITPGACGLLIILKLQPSTIPQNIYNLLCLILVL